MSVMACICCRQIKTRRFSKEHVVPQAFGHFHDNLTLSCVCGACNSFFAQEHFWRNNSALVLGGGCDASRRSIGTREADVTSDAVRAPSCENS